MSLQHEPKVPQDSSMDLSPIQEFYRGQNIFITGGTGFIGKLLIEKLLRSCPGIGKLYLLIRPKNDKAAKDRLENLFKDPIFELLKKQRPNFLEHIRTIGGDCSKPGLGISPADKEIILGDVSIIFHVAATVKFNENIKLAVDINVQGPFSILNLCKEMTKLKSAVFVSTAYSNCNRFMIDEKFYDVPIEGTQLITLMNCINETKAHEITPHLLENWPNTYTFTKAAAENIIKNESGDLPISIFRPAMVISTYKEPLRGWIDNFYGPTGVLSNVITGFLRSMHCDESLRIDIVPGDMTVHAIIASAWDAANLKKVSNDIPIYNYVSNDSPITYMETIKLTMKNYKDTPTTKAVWYQSFRCSKYRLLHTFNVWILHFLPAFVFDFVSTCLGKGPRMVKIYKKLHKFIEVLNYFVINEWAFSNDRVAALNKKLSVKDRELFFFDMKVIDWEMFFQTFVRGIRVYLFKDPIETLPQARVSLKRLFWKHQALKFLTGLAVLKFGWIAVMKLFSILV